MSSSTPRGLPGFLRRSMRNDMVTMYNDYEDNVDNNIKNGEQEKAKEENLDMSSSNNIHTTSITSTSTIVKENHDSNDYDYDNNVNEKSQNITIDDEEMNRVDRKFRLLRTPSTDKDDNYGYDKKIMMNDEKNNNNQTHSKMVSSSSIEEEEQEERQYRENNHRDDNDENKGLASTIKKSLFGFTSSDVVTTTPSASSDISLPITTTTSPLDAKSDGTHSTIHPSKVTVTATTIETKYSSAKPKKIRSMNYKEAEFEKVITEPVVNIASLRKLGWNGIPVSSK